uniref:ParB-like N-terminal domain-containing protein n=1 Tax=viral metagenome TaxID=1070528 RepID=A0A6M3LRR3_9ZZZZ
MKVKLSEIKNAEPKREHGDISALRESIRECGLIEPLVIDEAGNLLAGRRRYQAVSELGWTEVECHVLPVNGDQVNAFRIAIHENTRRKQLTEVEEAVANNELHEMLVKQYGGKPAGNPSKFNASNIDQLNGHKKRGGGFPPLKAWTP